MQLARQVSGWVLAGLLASAALARAQVLFSDDFQTDSSAAWEVFPGSADGVSDYTVEWAFDYGTATYVSNGVTQTIPPAPNSAGGATRGVKITVNNSDETAAQAAVSLYPKGKTFSGDYALKVDMWMNYNGPAFGGTGSTEHAAFGLNHAGDKVVWDLSPSGTDLGDGVWFSVAGEAGAGTTLSDYNAYVGDGWLPPARLGVPDGGYLDRDEDGTAEREINAAAASPLKEAFPAPPGETPGAPGKQWVQVELRQRTVGTGETYVTWLMNGYVIAEHNQGESPNYVSTPQTSGNLMLGYMDCFSSIANPRADNYVIFDNLRVESLAGVPLKPVVSITAGASPAVEPSTPAELTVSRQADDLSAPLEVKLRVSGTATSGVDYQALPAEVEIPAGQASVTIPVTPIDDPLGEPTETVSVAVAGSDAYDVRLHNFAVVTLEDDGDVPEASISAFIPAVYEPARTRQARFSVGLATTSASDLTIHYGVGGTAVSGADYQALSGSVVVPAGETNAQVSVTPIDNAATDGDRTVAVTLTAGTGYKLGANTNATVIIRDDDLPPGQVLYTETFETDATSRWTLNNGPSDGVADFFYDYSQVGVPPAPRSSGTTRGLRLQVNQTSAVFGGLSVSPNGQSFSGNYRLRFDLWQNFNGPLPDGGSGSTQITGGGVGTAGTSAQWPGGTQDSVWFATTADGGSSVDYRAYSPAAGTGYGDASGVFAAGAGTGVRTEAHPYYAEFGRESAPEAQLSLYPDQAGESYRGSQGFRWHDVVIEKLADQVNWYVDGLILASVSLTNVTLGGGNILLVYSDINTSVSADVNAPYMLFGLIDNVQVEGLPTAAEPATLTSIQVTGGIAAIEFDGEASDTPAAFKLYSGDAVNGSYTQESGANISQTAPGQFRVEVATSGQTRFYRVVR